MSQVRLHDLYMQTLERTWVEKKNSIIACSLTVDGWSSNSDVHYLGITAHFIDDTWNFISLPLDFVPLSRSTGETVQEDALDALDALERRGIDANKCAHCWEHLIISVSCTGFTKQCKQECKEEWDGSCLQKTKEHSLCPLSIVLQKLGLVCRGRKEKRVWRGQKN